jgi:tetratricopeptide (TPR) repeat protein
MFIGALLSLSFLCVVAGSDNWPFDLETSVNKCDACVAITYQLLEEMRYHEKTNVAMLGPQAAANVVDLNLELLCDNEFGHKLKYSVKSINGVDRLNGPGLEPTSAALGASGKRKETQTLLLTKCKELMSESDSRPINSYFQIRTDSTQNQTASSIFRGVVKALCVDQFKQCASMDQVALQMKHDYKEVAELKLLGHEEILRMLNGDDFSPTGQIDFLAAKEKCLNGMLSAIACQIVRDTFYSVGSDAFRKYLEAKKGPVPIGENEQAQETLRYGETALTHALDIDPQHALSHYTLGYISKEAGRLGKAFKTLETVVSLAEESGDHTVLADAWNIMAETLFDASKMDDAVDAALKAVAADPDHVQAKRMAGKLLITKVFVSIGAIEGSVDVHFPEDFWRLGDLHQAAAVEQGASSALSAAVNLFVDAMILDATTADIVHLGVSLYLQQAAESAALSLLSPTQLFLLSSAEDTCKSDPKGSKASRTVCEDVFVLAGTHLLQNGYAALASDALMLALSVRDKSALIWGHLGTAHLKMDNIEASEQCFQKMLQYSDKKI